MKTKDVPRAEFIGMNVEVIEAENPSLIGLKGKIIDETKNTFTIQTKQKTRKVIKNQITLKTKIKQKTFMIKGEVLQGRPEDRLKKRIGI